MSPIQITKLDRLIGMSEGIPQITIGLIDGPIKLDHPAFKGSHIELVDKTQHDMCQNAASLSCMHGTFIAGMLCSERGKLDPAICPGCKLLLRPIFSELSSHISAGIPTTTEAELAKAIVQTTKAGAKIINLSVGLSNSNLRLNDEIMDAYNYSLRNGVILVVAAGNEGNLGSNSLINHPWVIPVGACDDNGMLVNSSYGRLVANQGLMAPGVNIISTSARGDSVKMSGTSFAAPFVTGTIALLWSIYRNAKPSQIVLALRSGHLSYDKKIIPDLLDASIAMELLKKII